MGLITDKRETFIKTFFVKLTVLFITTCLPFQLTGQNVNEEATADTSYISRLTLLPVLGTAPETSFMFGGVAMQQFKPAGAGPETRPSNIILSSIYTLNNQILVELIPAIILPEESWILAGSLFAYYFPANYWGIGSDTKSEDQISIEYKMFFAKLMGLKRISDSFYIGPIVRWFKNYDFVYKDSEGEPIESVGLTGHDGGSGIGIGGAIRWDKRDRIMTPTKNHFLELIVTVHPQIFGTSYSYSEFRLDGRKYLDLAGNGNSVLAFHALLQVKTGDIPFLDSASIGGSQILRGYYHGRFRDNHSLQLQSEFRQHLKGRFGLALFGGIGNVWPRWSDIELNHTKWAAGGGLRFNLNPGDTTNLRIDFAAGPNTTGLYLTLGEAF
jgi:hypothetical protein